MKILVIWTPDGDVYFRGDRQTDQSRAADFAADIVLTKGFEMYDQEDRDAVKECVQNRDWRALRAALQGCGAIKERHFQ